MNRHRLALYFYPKDKVGQSGDLGKVSLLSSLREFIPVRTAIGISPRDNLLECHGFGHRFSSDKTPICSEAISLQGCGRGGCNYY